MIILGDGKTRSAAAIYHIGLRAGPLLDAVGKLHGGRTASFRAGSH